MGRTSRMVALLAALGMAAMAQPAGAAPATVEEFLAICPPALFDRPSLNAAQKEVGLRMIDNSPLAFGWGTMTFTTKEKDRGVALTKMVFADAERQTCVAELERQMSFDEVEELKAALEAVPSIGALDGKIYPYPAGSTNATLKRVGGEPLVVVGVAASGGRTTLSIDVWTGKAE